MSDEYEGGAQQYQISRVIEGWKADGTRYRRVVTREGKHLVEKAVDGRYVPDPDGDFHDD